MSIVGINKDKFGTKLKFPTRDCKLCQRFPCFSGIEKCLSNFAAYGCSIYLAKYDYSS